MDQETHVIIVFAAREPANGVAGGIHKAVLGQIAAFHSKNIETHLITASERCANTARQMGADVFFHTAWHSGIKPFFKLGMLRYLITLHRVKPVAVIHHSGRTWLWGYCFFPGIPNIQVLHRETTKPYRFFRNWISLSHGFAADLKKKSTLAKWRRIAIVPNCLIEAPKEKICSVRSPKKDRPFVLGFMGRGGEGKGIDVLFRAVSSLCEQGLKYKVLIAGHMDDYIKEKAKIYGVGPFVDYLGWVEDVKTFYSQIDLFVLPSRKESFGLVLIEAMSRAKPVLATSCNGPLDIVKDGKTGYLVPIGDANAMAQKIVEASRDETLMQKGTAGFDRVKTHYTPQVVGNDWIRVLREFGAQLPPHI